MNALRFWLMTLLAALLLPAAARAQDGTPHIAATLLAESDRPAPGQTVTIAFVMKPQPGWHGYWKNPGDAGLETELKWTLPAGVTAGPLSYPVPERLMIAGLMNYVYEGDHTLFATLTVPAGMAAGTRLPVRVRADWLECTDKICVPAGADLATDLTVGDGGIDPARRAAFDGWRARIPKPLGGQAQFAVAGGKIRLAVPWPAGAAIEDPYFYPLTADAIDYAAPQQVLRNGDMLVVETGAREGAAGMKAIEGVLKIGDNRGLAVAAVPGAVPAGGDPLGAAAPALGVAAVLLALGGALLGGLLLNIMPCVFPILSLKALSLAKAGVDERSARREGLAYAAGVILVCVALGAALIALRAAGGAAGWAFQLQDPRVITLLMLLTAGIAFNLAGLFELGSIGFGDRLAAQGGVGGAFWTGALAAFIATPCTGPFMGAALGAALVLPAGLALAIFAGLGLGLALPFLLLGFVPALRRRLPKPGPWMNRFRHVLSVPMFLTALGLAWILGRQAGVDGMTLGLVALLALGLALWFVGARQRGAGGRGWLALVPALAVALAVIATVDKAPADARAEAGGALAAEPFSEARLAALTAEGRPVFVYFTADWCLTCKVNEKAAIERAEVADAFAAGKVAVLVGDWTNGDPVIGRFIERQGRSGVPLYLYYRAGSDRPDILPQVLTVDRLVSLAG
ncbi:MAG: thiol:disulfide interchange protein [Sphingomonas sp. SCN 67-18]|uniref:protein-disulfide reductase DsbD family protein n=1 Tax=uncultured Sphingomonas sp. TaxID=158754 RepID=UPI00086B0F21|nr:protein-disulfide reductase DsbD domain-containing protein [Sphingomonas sp. SCN 67-18]ODU20500.1 MAG: thiol:disulfide interchange protein [Sphingomonas sp. SCN 67-18]